MKIDKKLIAAALGISIANGQDGKIVSNANSDGTMYVLEKCL